MNVELQPGEVLDDRFIIFEVIGRGGMGTVYRANDLSTGRPVAIKVPFFELESDPVFYSRFEREIDIGRRLDHPGILKVLNIENASRPYLAMEYLEGETLWDRLHRDGPLPTADAVCITTLLCEALEHMHARDVIHRDLKPTNVMLCRDGSVRIMDFGIAVAVVSRRLTFAGMSARLGTPNYMSPEQVKGRRADTRTDLYSLGAILYEMTTGHAPYDDQPDLYSVMNARLFGDPVAPRVYNPALAPEIEEIALHALERDPKDRYQSAGAMKADLASPCGVRVSGRASRLTVPRLTARYWRVARVVVIALAVPVLLFFAFLYAFSR